jgi:two-component system, NtrC family, response regulator AtoC
MAPGCPPDPISHASHASSPRVLVIEDDANLREIVSTVLTSFGYDCQTAEDGQSGLARFDEGGWDLVLTDLVMPEVGGWEVVEAIRQRAPTLPVVLLTGLSNPTVLRRALECQVTVVVKPFQVQTLKAAMVEALYAKLV